MRREPMNQLTNVPALQTQTALDPAQLGGTFILSVDDDAAVLYSRQKILEAAGYYVLSASDGKQALGYFAAVLVDLVVVDYAMPGMNGGMVARFMKTKRPL